MLCYVMLYASGGEGEGSRADIILSVCTDPSGQYNEIVLKLIQEETFQYW